VATVNRIINADPAQVWAVLADALSYSEWVVGAKDIREVEGPWPAPGSRFHHTVGAGLMNLKDNTKVLVSESRYRLMLEARARPLGRAHVDLMLTRAGTGTAVSLREDIVSPAVMKPLNPVLAPLIRARNKKTLKRLASVVGARR
jgi:hypothetical protein